MVLCTAEVASNPPAEILRGLVHESVVDQTLDLVQVVRCAELGQAVFVDDFHVGLRFGVTHHMSELFGHFVELGKLTSERALLRRFDKSGGCMGRKHVMRIATRFAEGFTRGRGRGEHALHGPLAVQVFMRFLGMRRHALRDAGLVKRGAGRQAGRTAGRLGLRIDVRFEVTAEMIRLGIRS